MPSAIDGPAIAGGIYGFARGLQDAERADMARQAFEGDQAVRKRQLKRADQLDELDQLNIDRTKLEKDQVEEAQKEAKEALRVHGILRDSYRNYQLSGNDPTHLAEGLKKLDPDKLGNATATRTDDGTITIDGGNGHPMIFRGGTKLPDGSTMSADDEVLHWMSTYMDPVKAFQSKYADAQKMGIEKERTERALGVAGVRADATGNRQSEAWTNRQLTQIKPVLDSMLKTQGVSGSFISGYAHEDDAELRGVIEEATEAGVMQGQPVRKAARAAVEDVRQTYDKAQGLAKNAAAAVSKSGVDPRDRAAVEKAAKEGNKDAQKYLQIIQATEQALGPGLSRYMLKQMPAKGG